MCFNVALQRAIRTYSSIISVLNDVDADLLRSQAAAGMQVYLIRNIEGKYYEALYNSHVSVDPPTISFQSLAASLQSQKTLVLVL